jgi:hypothetical protein
MARRHIRLAAAAAAISLTILGSAVAQAAPAPVTITFDDDRLPNTAITCASDPACAPAHHAWLRGKGIDAIGAPNGNLWTSRLEGPLSRRRVGLGYVAPGWSDADGGVSANEALAIRFLNAYSSRVEIELSVLPTNDPLVNNVPTRAVVHALDENCQAVAQNSLQFTGVTRGRLTPARLTLVAPRMGTILLQVEEHAYGGVFVQSIRTTPVDGPRPSQTEPCDPSKPVKAAEPTPRPTTTPRATTVVQRTATRRATATPRRSATARPTNTAVATATPALSSAASACVGGLAAPAQSTRAVGEAVSDLAQAVDCLNRRGEAPQHWHGQLLVRFNGVQRHVVRGDLAATGRMLQTTGEHLNKLRQGSRQYSAAAGVLLDATERLRVRLSDPASGPL